VRILWIAGSYPQHQLFYTVVPVFRHETPCLIDRTAPDLSTESTGTGDDTRSSQGIFGGLSMISDRSEIAIDQIVASCNGDLRGALKALLLVNEQLEAELQQFYAAAARDALVRGGQLLH
jgi:hypothetical protein